MGAYAKMQARLPKPVRIGMPFGPALRMMLPKGVHVARLDPNAPVFGRVGSLEVRLARSREEIRAAQLLRYRVFYEEMSAKPSAFQKVTRRDRDGFDRFCDHLLVIDRALPEGAQIVGTYRLLRQREARLAGGFYTAGEFEIEKLVARHPGKRFLELGRSCVLREYRGKRTVELLWQGIWAYVTEHRIDVMFGCASLAGTDLARLSGPLAFLREHAPAPAEWRVGALPERRAAAPMPGSAMPLEHRQALAALPPLLKGYLRLGCYIGEDAVVDEQFGTTDVLIVLPTARIDPRYASHYEAKRLAA